MIRKKNFLFEEIFERYLTERLFCSYGQGPWYASKEFSFNECCSLFAIGQ